ncbi:hypothetical protein RchiOBHm_Chr2g0115081 [Rosa chinensis]|uniref:Uncharacterized protein n=1 Tax=Rosa chinensis TaxID=74649 RepID=A0A2P6RQX5_ROSCH|nr:uncharacterized protein LOC112189144 [Rosa chinensis]PRQ48828.1 hypothetical protein RchiOBHm_Chr2g0115081 [Rosa chinensis]
MSNDNSADGSCKTRSALGDLTNRPLKRGFLKISADSEPKSGDGYGGNVGCRDGVSRKLAKQVSLGDENMVREKLGEDCNPKGLSSPKGMPDSVISPTCSAGDSTNDNNASVVVLDDDIGEKSNDSVMEVGDASRDNCLSVASMSTCSELCKNGCCDGGGKCQYEKPGQTSDDAQSTPTCEGLGNVVPRNDERDPAVGKVGATKYGSTEWSKMPTSLGSSMARCTTVNSAADLNAGDDLLNDCSCSFCLQAAHILSDLQYQDIKGRISALKKSQKEAGILVQKSFRGKEIDPKGPRYANKTSKLESDLSSQWRSLFLHMEDIFVNEGNHLHDKFVTLKDLRDNCKMELETAVGVPSERL